MTARARRQQPDPDDTKLNREAALAAAVVIAGTIGILAGLMVVYVVVAQNVRPSATWLILPISATLVAIGLRIVLGGSRR